MALDWSRSSIVLLILVLACDVQATHYPNTRYVQGHCGDTYTVSGDMKIKLMGHRGFLPASERCVITLKPRNGDRLVARMTKYKMSTLQTISSSCSSQALHLTGETSGKVWGDKGYCKILRPRDQYNLGKYGTFGYSTGGGLFANIIGPKAADVTLLVTEMWDKDGTTKACPKDTFDCDRKNYCVAEDVTCNGYNDCGNNDDEVEGCGLTTGIIAAIAVGIIVFIAVVIGIIVLIIKCK